MNCRVDYEIIPDRVEAGTLMIAAALTNGEVEIENVIPRHVEALIRKLHDAGIKLNVKENSIQVTANGTRRAVDLKTHPYPGFPTDLQPQLTTLLSVSQGTSVVAETIFENRFMHVPELNRMGADIRVEGNRAVIHGVKKLSGAPVRVSDLRAGAALVLAGLVAEGETEIEDNDRHLIRGYEDLVGKLRSLGGDISVPKTKSTLRYKS